MTDRVVFRIAERGKRLSIHTPRILFSVMRAVSTVCSVPDPVSVSRERTTFGSTHWAGKPDPGNGSGSASAAVGTTSQGDGRPAPLPLRVCPYVLADHSQFGAVLQRMTYFNRALWGIDPKPPVANGGFGARR